MSMCVCVCVYPRIPTQAPVGTAKLPSTIARLMYILFVNCVMKGRFVTRDVHYQDCGVTRRFPFSFISVLFGMCLIW